MPSWILAILNDQAMSKREVSESALFFNTEGHQSFPSSLRCTSIEEVLSLLYSGAYFLHMFEY